MRHSLAIAVALLAVAGFAAAENVADPELTANVPSLVNLHEVIAPLWHDAFPQRDVAMVKELLPALKDGVAKVQAATLPGILRDKSERWQAGVAALVAATTECERALAAADTEATLAAVEDVHARFEGLVRTVRPRLKELEAYHVVLYTLVHRHAPARSLAGLRDSSPALVAVCDTLTKAPLPPRLADRGEAVKAGIAELCTATARFATTTGGEDVDAALAQLDIVHTLYQALEHTLD